MIHKAALDAVGSRRLRHEKAVLAHLAAVDGVPRLAGDARDDDLLALHDTGGSPLSQHLANGPLEPATITALGARLARILAGVHRAGVVHADLHPANVLLAPGGEPMLIDFGLALVAGTPAAPRDGNIVGTLAYLAPEQTGRTGRPVDHRADLYALGATLYEMACGRVPFESQDTLQLIHDHLVRKPVEPALVDPTVPQVLSQIIMRLLAKEPEQRYQSAEGLAWDLQRLHDGLAGGAEAGFTLGERDFPARLAPPARLVGREPQLDILQRAFEEAAAGGRRVVFVEGPPGVGKSALAQQLKPAVAARGGRFVYAKFDQYQGDSATSGAVVHAMRALGRLLLAEPREALAPLRERVMQRLGHGAGLLADLPEYAALLGPLPERPAVDPAQAEERISQATLGLITEVASPSRPLVIVLDDLQWGSARSLRCFESVLEEPQMSGILMIGNYRASGVDAAHALAPLLQRLRALADAPIEISLGSLAPHEARDLLANMLRLEPGPAGELAGAIGTLAAGNPFDTLELVNAIRADGLLRLGERDWEWDAEAIRRYVGRGNVADLLASRLSRLSAQSRRALECMSCLGSSIDRPLLQAALGLSDAELDEALRLPLEDGLVLEEGIGPHSLRFRHDRVQQAVLAGLLQPQREALQLQMARRLAQQSSFRQHMTQQYLGCAHLLDDAEEMRRVASLFHSMARRLANAAHATLAESFLAAAARLLARLDERGPDPLRDQVEMARHAALYSLGRLDEADEVYAILERRITDPVALAEPACLQIRSLEWRARSPECVPLGLDLLARLGRDVPADYAGAAHEQRLDELQAWGRGEKDAAWQARESATDVRALACARILSRLQRSVFVVHKGAATWMMHESARLWDDHGPSAALVMGLARMSAILIQARGEFRAGYEAARSLLVVADARAFEPDSCEARIVFAIGSCHWFEPLENVIGQVARARAGLTGGDSLYVCYSYRATLPVLLDTAETLDSFEAELAASTLVADRTNNHHAALVNRIERWMLDALRGAPGDAPWPALLRGLPMAEFNWHLRAALLAVLRGEADALAAESAKLTALLRVIPGYYTIAHAWLFRALALAWRLQAGGQTVQEAERLSGELEICRAWLAQRAADQALNFSHLLRLVEAEQAWSAGDHWRAAKAFESAMAEAGERRRPWHRALITERAALFHLAQGLEHTGRTLLAQAHDRYAAWGARAKVEHMRLQHAWLRPAAGSQAEGPVPARPSGTFTPDTLDLMGVLRSSQALSSETSLEQLTARVTEVLAGLTGATRVCVLSWYEDQWWLVAPARGDALAAPAAPAAPAVTIALAEAGREGMLALSAVRYAERTGQPLRVDDAPRDDRFARDPYFSGLADCSLLVVPIAGQGTTRAMLYLENRMGRAAFSAERLDAVMLIAGQLAVSLANARLYESLEQRVSSRTRELEQTQAALVASARQAGKAEIANNVLHNVGNVLNSISVSAGVVRNTLVNSRLGKLADAVALLRENAGDLARFFADDPRSRALLPYLEEISKRVEDERAQALGDLDRLVRSVDHITYVVSSQQSHAGPSSIVEPVTPGQVLEDALQMCAEQLRAAHVAVTCTDDALPPMALDRQRLMQIVVNLIRNAVRAMDALPRSQRQLVLGCDMRHEMVEGGAAPDAARLRFTVRDNGEGIAPANLARLFTHGFTTRIEGHGFGLHSSAVAAMEMGGRLTAHSEGAGRGATFTLDLPAGDSPSASLAASS